MSNTLNNIRDADIYALQQQIASMQQTIDGLNSTLATLNGAIATLNERTTYDPTRGIPIRSYELANVWDYNDTPVSWERLGVGTFFCDAKEANAIANCPSLYGLLVNIFGPNGAGGARGGDHIQYYITLPGAVTYIRYGNAISFSAWKAV